MYFFFFKQKTAYEMRISDWSSDVCSSDLDIVDRDLDAKVERTRSRPLASGAVSLKAAWVWLLLLCLLGFAVLLQLSPYAAVVALASLAPVAAYPFMKRITWWPQAWLGLVFSWAALVGWSEIAGGLTLPGLMLYAGCICWVIGDRKSTRLNSSH